MCTHVCAVSGSGERRQKYRAGENRQVIGDGEVGTGIKSDRERGRIQGIMKGRNKEIEYQKAREWAWKEKAPETQ